MADETEGGWVPPDQAAAPGSPAVGSDAPSIGARHLQELRAARAAAEAEARATAPPAPGWWQASDGQWYPPESYPGGAPPGYYPAPAETKSRAPLIIAIAGLSVLGIVIVLILAVTVLGKVSKPVVAGASDGFTAEFPFRPRRSEQTASQLGAQLKVVTYETVTNKEDVGISFTNLPAVPSPLGVQRGLDAAVDGVAAKTETSIVSRANTTFAGSTAEDAVLSGSGKAIHVRVFVVGSRAFQVTGITHNESDPRPNYERLLTTFQAH